MLVYSESTASLLELYGVNILVDDVQTEDGRVEKVFRVVGYSIGFNFVLGNYPSEMMARQILEKIARGLADNEPFFDVKSEEEKLFKE